MLFNVQKSDYSSSLAISKEKWPENDEYHLYYGGWSLAGAKECFVRDEIDLEELETIVELILLETAGPNEKHGSQFPSPQMQWIGDGALIEKHMRSALSASNFHQVFEVDQSYSLISPKPDHFIMPPSSRKLYGATVAI